MKQTLQKHSNPFVILIDWLFTLAIAIVGLRAMQPLFVGVMEAIYQFFIQGSMQTP